MERGFTLPEVLIALLVVGGAGLAHARHILDAARCIDNTAVHLRAEIEAANQYEQAFP